MSDVQKYCGAMPISQSGIQLYPGATRYVLEVVYDALAQQLAASQAREQELRAGLDNAKLNLGNWSKRFKKLESENTEAQATITRLEATISKALDLDYQRRQEIAEAVGLLTRANKNIKEWMVAQPTLISGGDRKLSYELDAYLAAHEEKAND